MTTPSSILSGIDGFGRYLSFEKPWYYIREPVESMKGYVKAYKIIEQKVFEKDKVKDRDGEM